MHRISWVFGYGSLMWDPGFDPTETVRARLEGYARSFCLRSIEHRGTPDRPGLVLGLDADMSAHCTGLALRIPEGGHDDIIAALRARELVTQAYAEALVPLALEDGRQVQALAYVMRRDHWQYAGGLAAPEQARIIALAHGRRGPNADYLFNTARHLAQIGLADENMDALSDAVRQLLTPSDGLSH
ncbi:MAG: gamma-glutamylcyclotransferase [Paracoccus sp. (in: a-proteobacteria)]|uniref:gamma-glutamylcyclotransferase n=1 Tax=Paracoccus sp. TaxID=267 RepID=UPI0026DFC1F1|nr:gamma-glutamylcyclotransferase [Paracoccus sp. (in: a-proteobacteria)]MDO5613449.1 gamma-glutamylcyclotransferase [Paracoccus sp. (in: a-proteobacteria)]